MAAGKTWVKALVPQTIFRLVVDGEIISLEKLCRCLNEKLKIDGGHIGYSI